MFNLNDFKTTSSESHIYKLVNDADRESIGALFARSEQISNTLKQQLEDRHSDLSYLSCGHNVFSNKLLQISSENSELCRSIVISGDIQAQIEIYHLIFKSTIEQFVLKQESIDTDNNSRLNESEKEILVPETQDLFRSYQNKTGSGLIGNVLAKSGVKMVFIFMQKLWRDGNEIDVESCVEIMKNAIEEIQQINVAGFFNLSDDTEILPFWSGVTEQTYQFLKSTVLCAENAESSAPKPIREAALVLLLEIGLIYGSLSMQLKHVIMLIQLSVGSKNYPDLPICFNGNGNSNNNNEVPVIVKPMVSAHILSVLTRLAKFVRQSATDASVSCDIRSVQISTNPCLRLLNWMRLESVKSDDSGDADICLLNAAVYIMSCLDSLTIENQLSYSAWYKSHLISNTENNPSTYKYENILNKYFSSAEKSSHKLFLIRLNTSSNLFKNDLRESKLETIEIKSDKLPREENEKFRIKKIISSGINTYVLTECGWLYEINNTSEELIECFTFKHNSINHQFDCLKNETWSKLAPSNRIVDVDANVYSSHVLAVTEAGQVYSWGTNTSGKLGHGDTKDKRRPTVIDLFTRAAITIKQVACGEEHSLILSQTGDIYSCGRNHMGQLGLGDVKDRHLPTRLTSTDLLGVTVKQVAVDGHQSMCLSNDGIIFVWGSTFENCRRHSCNWTPKIDTCVHEYRNEIEQIQVHDSTYMILLKSGSVYSWLKYCLECNKSDDTQFELDTVLKYQVDNVTMISKGDGEFYFLDKSGIIRTKKLIKITDQKFSGFGFIKRNFILAWSQMKEKPKFVQPFILEVSIENLKLLSRLISSIIVNFGTTDNESNNTEKIDSSSNWFKYLLRINPNCKYELTEDRLCILVSSLHLLSVQLQKIVEERLTIPSSLLVQLKRDIINCCCGAVSQLHVSIKHAAHMCLISGWKILFSSQMEKLLGIYYTLQIAESSISRYNLIVVMCLNTIDLKQFINTLIELTSSSTTTTGNSSSNSSNPSISDLPSIECVIDTIVKYTFTHIRSQLKVPTNHSLNNLKNKELVDIDSLTNNGSSFDNTGDQSIIEKLLNFLCDLLKQTVYLLKDSKVTQDCLQPTLKSILTIYGKILAQQAIETVDYCWSLINKSSITPKQLVYTLKNSGFCLVLLNFIESVRWLLKNYLQTKSIPKSFDHSKSASLLSSTTATAAGAGSSLPTSSTKTNPKLPNTTTSSVFHYDLLFKFSVSMREIVFAFKPLVLLLDKINRLNESISSIDDEDGSLPGWLYNSYSHAQEMIQVSFRMKDLLESNGQLIVVEGRVYDIDKLPIDSRNKFEDLLPHRNNSIFITEIVHKSLYRKEILQLLINCYCGEFVDDDSQPIPYCDSDSEDCGQLYFMERMLLVLMSDVLLFHQSCCSLMKRSIGFKQLQEFSIDKFPPVLKQIVLKKKSDQLQTNSTANNSTILSFGHLEEKERDEVEETNDLSNSNPITGSNDDNNRKIISSCSNLLMHGSASSLIDKGNSPILNNILQWLRSDNFKIKTNCNSNPALMLDNIQDSHLDTLFVLILVAFTKHVNMTDELANHIMRRNYDQPISNELTIVIQQSISIRKDIIKRHQQMSTSYKELCSNISVRCRFLIDEIELLSINNASSNSYSNTSNNNFANRKKSVNLTELTTDLWTTNRWKYVAIKAVAMLKKTKKPTDYWQIIFNFIMKKFSNNKLKQNKVSVKSENCENINEFCGQINQFLLNKETIDLPKLKTLVLAKKIQYKCIINVLKEFRGLLQFSSTLLPGLQVSLLHFFCQKVPIQDSNDSGNDDEYIYDILQSVNSASTANFVSHHTRQSLLQIEHSLIQLCIQLLRENLLNNEQKMEQVKCTNLSNNLSNNIGVGYWPNSKLTLMISNILLQSISWSNDIYHTMLSNGVLGLIQTIFRQYFETEPGLINMWCQKTKNYHLITSDYKNNPSLTNRSESVEDLSDSAIALPSQLKKGTLVLRGRDWKYGDQDGPNSVGVVKREAVNGMVRVQWLNNKKIGSYRAGKDNYYDLRLKKSIEDVNKENYTEYGVRSLIKDIRSLHDKFVTNRMSRKNSEANKKSSSKSKLKSITATKRVFPPNWTQSSMLLLHSVGQLMQAITIQQLITNSSTKVAVPCQITFNKIYQLLWLIYKNGLLASIHKNDSVKNMYQEQIPLWCNENFLLILLSQQTLQWPDGENWLNLFLTKVELDIQLASNENVANQVLSFKIIEKLIDRSSISEIFLERLWNCLQQAVQVHCSQDMKMGFNVHSLNALPSKIRVMELAIIFRNILRNSSHNQLCTRQFTFDKISQCLSQPDNYAQLLGLLCLFTDAENRIYPGIPVTTLTKNNETTVEVNLGVVEEIGNVDDDKYVVTTVSASDNQLVTSFTKSRKDYECHNFTIDMQIDASKIKFPFEIFSSVSEKESQTLSKFLLMLISNFVNSNDESTLLSKTSPMHNLFSVMQVSTVMEFCEHNLTEIWNPLNRSNDRIFKCALMNAARASSVKPEISAGELKKALNQLSFDLCTAHVNEVDGISDVDQKSDTETENAPKNQNKNHKKHSLIHRDSKTKARESEYKKESLNINLDLQERIMEMGFTKRQILLAIREIERSGNHFSASNPELIVTTILNFPPEYNYSFVPINDTEENDDDDDDEDDDNSSFNMTDESGSCSSGSEEFKFISSSLKHRHRPLNMTTEQSINTSDNDDNPYFMEKDDNDSNEEDNDETSSVDNASEEDEKVAMTEVKQSGTHMVGFENVVCINAFESISVGDKGCINLNTHEHQNSCDVFWTKVNQFIDTKKENIHIFTNPFSSLVPGDEVQFSESGIRNHAVSTITALSSGVIRQIVRNNDLSLNLIVDFPNYLGKICELTDVKLVAKDFCNCQCQSCLKAPLSFPMHKCKVCKDLYLCSNCYLKFQKNHDHKFITIGVEAKIQDSTNPSQIDNYFTSSRQLQTVVVSQSTNKSELKQCLSFSNWLINPTASTKNIEFTTKNQNKYLVKISEGFEAEKIFMLISLSEFLSLPSQVIVKGKSKSKKIPVINFVDVNSLKAEEIINSSKFYNPESKLMWLKIYNKKNKSSSNNRMFSLKLADESHSLRTVFNAVKSFHFHLSKLSDAESHQSRMENGVSATVNNENLLKTIFTISDKNWSANDIDAISNNTVSSWRQARINKLRFQINSTMRDKITGVKDFEPSVETENKNSSQGDVKLKNRLKSKVYVWGLNDKDQLGCEAPSKVKLPVLNKALSELDCVAISGGSKSLFCVTRNGKVFVAGDPSNGRLGIGPVSDVTSDVINGPKKLETLDKYFILKVSVHSGGRHAMALTKNGEVFSWGEGDDGKLGHNSRLKLDYPRKIRFFKGKRVVDIACGSSHSAAIVFGGQLYTWGLGDYGRLGHGDTATKLLPEIVKSLRDYKVVQVACGSRDAQTLALTSDFTVWSWGDGDFGKLGRGGSSGCLVPQKIECISLTNVIQIECGAQSSFALTETGQVWTWGKGDYYRLGHGTDKHIREPMLVEDLKDIKIVHLAVGALHCLAVTDQGQVFSWGDNDHGQQGNGTVSYNMRPTQITSLSHVKVAHVACGSSHSVAWTASDLDSFLPSQSLNRWPHVKEIAYSLAVMDFSPLLFHFNPDPLGSGDLLDIDQNIYQKKKKSIELSQNPDLIEEQSGSCKNLAMVVAQLRGSSTRNNVIQSLFVNLKVLVARKLVSQLFTRKILSNSSQQESLDPLNLMSNDDHLMTMETFLLTFDYMKLHHIAPMEPCVSPEDILRSVSFSDSNNLRQIALLLLIDEIEKYGDKDSNKNSIHNYCDNKDFVNIIKRSRFISFVRESHHPYNENSNLHGKVMIPDAPRLIVEFDKQCSTERNKDVLVLMDHTMSVVAERSGQRWEDWGSKVIVNGNELHWSFKSDGSITSWGWRFEVKPLWKQNQELKLNDDSNEQSDYNEIFLLFLPNLHLIKCLLNRIEFQLEDTSLALQLIKSLSQMAFTRSTLDNESRIWAVRQILAILRNKSLDVFRHFMDALDSFSSTSFSMTHSRYDAKNAIVEEEIPGDQQPSVDNEGDELSSDEEQPEKSTQLINDMDIIRGFLLCLQKVILKQFKFEEPEVKSSKQLFYSRFLKSLIELACYVRLDSLLPVSTADEWAWFRNYCLTHRTTESLITNASLPYRFLNEFKSRFLKEPTVKDPITREINTFTAVSEYADPREFSFQHDVQLINWLKNRPESWKKCWPTDSASGLEVWSWGHNHRGQLGGVEGSKIKVPVLCEHLSALRPRQIIGGEQSLFIVSVDGRVYATGFGNNGRLGIGSNESVQTPILVSGLEEKIVVKVAVNSGGKHCLALTNNGLVYAWGDAEDNKLGLDIRLQPAEDVLTPTLIRSLVKADIVDIAAGGSHSAAISRSGELYTWGKGRYGRLGHGNGDDQPLPKIVEALRGYHVIGVACGSGDAQTLCITKSTDDTREDGIQSTSVWSWGDGDYGKLGRGGFDICKLPMKIETLENANVIKVDCGSQFSLALTASGEVYTWGKGDYFRLGHGSDTHVRKPEKVAQLSKKKVIDVACGSLHCICCTEDGEVYSWGDNDEGQLGDGTTTTNSRPRIIETLTGKGINRVACGSAHTLSWTTASGSKSHETETPEQRLHLTTRPLSCNLLENKSAQSLINRFLLLHHWTELFCSNLHFIDLNRQSTMDSVRQILLPSNKESLFRLMIQTTMFGSKKHGPEIKVNRLHASAGTPAGVSILYRSSWMDSDNQFEENKMTPDAPDTGVGRTKIQLEKTVFGQLGSKLIEEADCISKNGSIYVPPPDFFLLPNRVWKVKLIGESVDDCGGGYSESITEICDELQNGHLPFLISSPDKDCFVLSPTTDKANIKWFIFLGCILGIAIRTNQPLSLTISDLIWKILSGQSLNKTDLQLFDKDLYNGLLSLKSMDDHELESLQIPYSVTTIDGKEVNLAPNDGDSSVVVTAANRDKYIAAIMHYKIHEFDEMCLLIRRGMGLVIPLPLLNLFSSRELECLICGNDSIPIAFLKSITLYRGVKSDDPIVTWFWEIMEEMTNEVRSLFLRFVWGRTRLPRYVSDLRGKEFVIQVLSKYSPADDYLPEAYTCFFLLKLPNYSSKAILQEKLLYAIHFCKSIDIDDYARIALNPDSLPCQESVINTPRREMACSQTSSSGSNSPRIYISNSSCSSSSSSQDEDSDASTARAPNNLFDSSPSLSDRYSIQRNNQYLVSDYIELFSGMFDTPRFIDMSLDTEGNDDESSDDDHSY